MGADELNYCIRNGNRCDLIANATGKNLPIDSGCNTEVSSQINHSNLE